MGVLTNLFTAAAKKRANKRHEIYLEEQSIFSKRQEAIDSITNRLHQIVDEHIEVLEKTACHIKVGDKVVLNIYELLHHNINGWDGGSTMLLTYIIQNEDLTKLPVFNVESIYVDKSLAYEKIDSYVRQLDYEILEFLTKQSNDTIKLGYFKYNLRGREHLKYANNFGLYKTAMFSSTYVFQPRWGLNVNSFLEFTTPAAKTARKIYKMHLKKSAMWKKHADFTTKIEENLKQAKLDYPV